MSWYFMYNKMTLYNEIYLGKHPFDLTGNATEDEIISNIKNNEIRFNPNSATSESAKELIKSLLDKNPLNRPKSNELGNISWFC